MAASGNEGEVYLDEIRTAVASREKEGRGVEGQEERQEEMEESVPLSENNKTYEKKNEEIFCLQECKNLVEETKFGRTSKRSL